VAAEKPQTFWDAKVCATLLQKKIRDLTEEETPELELATDEALGRVEPPPK
jgi:hypothetical protein